MTAAKERLTLRLPLLSFVELSCEMTMPFLCKLLCYVGVVLLCPGCVWAQTNAGAAGGTVERTSVFFEVERMFRPREAPFTQFALTLNRPISHAPRYSWQLAADGWAGGADPYVSGRLEGCRQFVSEKQQTQGCIGLGVYHEIRSGGVSPVMLLSAESEWLRGRLRSYASFERAFTAPTFTYYHVDANLTVWERRRWRLSTGVLSRTIQHFGGKVAVEVAGRTEVFTTVSSGQVTIGLSMQF